MVYVRFESNMYGCRFCPEEVLQLLYINFMKNMRSVTNNCVNASLATRIFYSRCVYRFIYRVSHPIVWMQAMFPKRSDSRYLLVHVQIYSIYTMCGLELVHKYAGARAYLKQNMWISKEGVCLKALPYVMGELMFMGEVLELMFMGEVPRPACGSVQCRMLTSASHSCPGDDVLQ